MGHGVLFVRVHLTEGERAAAGKKDRVIAEAASPARREDEGSLDFAAEGAHTPVRPGDGKDADEPGRRPVKGVFRGAVWLWASCCRS